MPTVSWRRAASWRIWFLYVLGATILLSMSSCMSKRVSPGAVEMRLRFKQGEVLTYNTVINTQLSGPRQETSRDVWGSVRETVSVLPNGNARMRESIGPTRVTVNGKAFPMESKGFSHLFEVTPDGRIVRSSPANGNSSMRNVDSTLYVLPGRPVSVGETWTRRFNSKYGPTEVTSELMSLDGKLRKPSTAIIKSISRSLDAKKHYELISDERMFFSVQEGRVIKQVTVLAPPVSPNSRSLNGQKQPSPSVRTTITTTLISVKG